jgi:hypothetical protein
VSLINEDIRETITSVSVIHLPVAQQERNSSLPFLRCDRCQNDVNGIRFDCVHCPALTFCEKCEQEATLNHMQENQALEQQQHVFKLIMKPEEEAFHFQ